MKNTGQKAINRGIDSNKLQQQAADLSSQIWAIANDLRGGMDANEFRNYIQTIKTSIEHMTHIINIESIPF